jgi:hypothetical protein
MSASCNQLQVNFWGQQLISVNILGEKI